MGVDVLERTVELLLDGPFPVPDIGNEGIPVTGKVECGLFVFNHERSRGL